MELTVETDLSFGPRKLDWTEIVNSRGGRINDFANQHRYKSKHRESEVNQTHSGNRFVIILGHRTCEISLYGVKALIHYYRLSLKYDDIWFTHLTVYFDSELWGVCVCVCVCGGGGGWGGARRTKIFTEQFLYWITCST